MFCCKIYTVRPAETYMLFLAILLVSGLFYSLSICLCRCSSKAEAPSLKKEARALLCSVLGSHLQYSGRHEARLLLSYLSSPESFACGI